MGNNIRIVNPGNSGSLYFNYVKFFSSILTSRTDVDCKFVYVDVGSYGVCSDSVILPTSEIVRRLSANDLNIPLARKFISNGDETAMPFVVLDDESSE